VSEADEIRATPDLECAIRIAPENNVFGGALAWRDRHSPIR
jgi:hypothetical protein